MRIALLTREFPPDVYGGAGVHVDFLVRELRRTHDVDVHCFGAPRDGAVAHAVPAALVDANFALQTFGVDLEMAATIDGCDVVHSHTWYANLAGHLGAILHGVPHVVTAHSLEPHRPWKAEQLGGGYRLSSWAERTAYEAADAIIAVSKGMRHDVLDAYPELDPDKVHVVLNGIDTAAFAPVESCATLERIGVDPDRPYVLFVGRITRQKGLKHLLAAAGRLEPGIQLVLCAGSPDTPEIAEETASMVAALRAQRGEGEVMWESTMLPREDLIELLTHATVFACPSIYEPLGIVNLEAMACETAVVASDVGGIPEVVVDGTTGSLVHYDERDPDSFDAGLAAAINALAADPARARAYGVAGRQRAVDVFGWDAVAADTVRVYEAAIADFKAR
ncbi:MAG TPA: glycogen synthase [Actinomycetes bacterium]|nr:glycogen synthase [Actinomycetes bacterium]